MNERTLSDVERAKRIERGKRLADLRDERGLKQRQVGAAFDIDKAAVSEWETGKSSPDRRKLKQLDEMYGGTGEVLRLYGVGSDLSSPEVVALRLRVEELERGMILLAEKMLEKFEVDQDLLALRDALESEYTTPRRAAQ